MAINPSGHLFQNQSGFLCSQNSNRRRDFARIISEHFHQDFRLEFCKKNSLPTSFLNFLVLNNRFFCPFWFSNSFLSFLVRHNGFFCPFWLPNSFLSFLVRYNRFFCPFWLPTFASYLWWILYPFFSIFGKRCEESILGNAWLVCILPISISCRVLSQRIWVVGVF